MNTVGASRFIGSHALLRTGDTHAQGESAASPTTRRSGRTDYRLGAVYALVTAALLALQEPFSALAARELKSADFIAFTQVSLLASIPLLVARPRARRDFVRIFATPRVWPKLAVLFGVSWGHLSAMRKNWLVGWVAGGQLASGGAPMPRSWPLH